MAGEEVLEFVERMRRAAKALDQAVAHRVRAEEILEGAEAYERTARDEFTRARGALLTVAVDGRPTQEVA